MEFRGEMQFSKELEFSSGRGIFVQGDRHYLSKMELNSGRAAGNYLSEMELYSGRAGNYLSKVELTSGRAGNYLSEM
jgi:hypothetical protein